jgi:uncharacterized repeat protein (TIGR03803 family)
MAGVVQGSDGNFYGTTEYGGSQPGLNGNGTVFKINAKGALNTLHTFAGNTDGANPQGGLVQGSDDNFYGTTQYGGANGLGTVFQISANGALTILYSFTGGTDGAVPFAGLAQGSDGGFYGTTEFGGTNNSGTVFKISAIGALTRLYSFTGGDDGANPEAVLVQGRDGNLYGTTCNGGAWGAGTVFRLSVGPAAPAFQTVTLTNGTLSLTWSTAAGERYQLQYTSDVSSSNWTDLGSAVTATGATLRVTNSVANGPRRFYRVALLP